MSEYACPHCHSENTASVPLVYKDGHYTGTHTYRGIVGYNVSELTVTDSDGHTSTTETGRTPIYGNITEGASDQTKLSSEVSPPRQPILHLQEYNTFSRALEGVGCLLPIALLAGLFVFHFVGGAIYELFNYHMDVLFKYGAILIVAVLLLHRLFTQQQNRRRRCEYAQAMQAYQRELAVWQEEYICMRCGCVFRPDLH